MKFETKWNNAMKLIWVVGNIWDILSHLPCVKATMVCRIAGEVLLYRRVHVWRYCSITLIYNYNINNPRFMRKTFGKYNKLQKWYEIRWWFSIAIVPLLCINMFNMYHMFSHMSWFSLLQFETMHVCLDIGNLIFALYMLISPVFFSGTLVHPEWQYSS